MRISILKACLAFCQIHGVVAKCATSIRGSYASIAIYGTRARARARAAPRAI